MATSESAGTGVGAQAASGVLWLAMQKWAVRISGFVTLIVLTRQVSPREFGVVAAAMTMIPFVYLLADLGFSTYLLQTDEVDQESLSTAFWTSVAAATLLSCVLFFVAPLLALAFRSPQLVPVLRVLILAIIPTVLAGVPLALLRRAMAFRSVAMQSLVAATVAQVAAVVTALAGAGVWALVSQVVVSQTLIAILAWRGAGWRPSLVVSVSQFWQMTAFGFRVSSVDLVATSRMWAEGWIISVTLGTAAFGLLNIAQRLVLVAQELTTASLVPVSTVLFAKVRESPERLRVTYLRALGVAYAVVSPIMILIGVLAPVLVPLLFGAGWQASVQPTQALALAGIVTLGAMLDHGLFYGLGRPGTWLAYSVAIDSATVATTAFAVRWGLTGVAAGFVAVAVVATALRWVLVGRSLGLSVRSVARPFRVVMVPTAMSIALGLLFMAAFSSALDLPLAIMLLAGSCTVVVNVVLLRLLAGAVIRDALGVLPVPAGYTNRVRRLLRLPLAETPPGEAIVLGPES